MSDLPNPPKEVILTDDDFGQEGYGEYVADVFDTYVSATGEIDGEIEQVMGRHDFRTAVISILTDSDFITEAIIVPAAYDPQTRAWMVDVLLAAGVLRKVGKVTKPTAHSCWLSFQQEGKEWAGYTERYVYVLSPETEVAS